MILDSLPPYISKNLEHTPVIEAIVHGLQVELDSFTDAMERVKRDVDYRQMSLYSLIEFAKELQIHYGLEEKETFRNKIELALSARYASNDTKSVGDILSSVPGVKSLTLTPIHYTDELDMLDSEEEGEDDPNRRRELDAQWKLDAQFYTRTTLWIQVETEANISFSIESFKRIAETVVAAGVTIVYTVNGVWND